VLAGILAAVFTFTDSTGRLSDFAHKAGVGGGSTSSKPVQLTGMAGYDPEGDGGEHNETASSAADGNANTYWKTEQYGNSNFGNLKNGVGLMLDAGSARKLSQLTVTTDTPGFTAQIKTGSSQSGPFAPASDSQAVGNTTTFKLHGASAEFYVVWITNLGSNSSVHVNEVTAKGR
jgi:hypothetical protein